MMRRDGVVDACCMLLTETTMTSNDEVAEGTTIRLETVEQLLSVSARTHELNAAPLVPPLGRSIHLAVNDVTTNGEGC